MKYDDTPIYQIRYEDKDDGILWAKYTGEDIDDDVADAKYGDHQ